LIALLFSVNGRIGRAQYWLGEILFLFVLAAAYLLGMWIADREMSALGDKFFYVGSIPVIASLLYSTVAIAIKRLHDRDKTGWWVVPLVLIPSPPPEIIARFTSESFGAVWEIVTVIVFVWVFIELGCLPGTTGPNRFGSDPRMNNSSGI
jgi:uncharacterized membrane protein YhaH (DUF805 family)